jgi:hypothetical protein
MSRLTAFNRNKIFIKRWQISCYALFRFTLLMAQYELTKSTAFVTGFNGC